MKTASVSVDRNNKPKDNSSLRPELFEQFRKSIREDTALSQIGEEEDNRTEGMNMEGVEDMSSLERITVRRIEEQECMDNRVTAEQKKPLSQLPQN